MPGPNREYDLRLADCLTITRHPAPIHSHSLLAEGKAIPRHLEIAPGRSIDDVSSLAEVEEVRRGLIEDTLAIEGKIDSADVDRQEGRAVDRDWQRRAKGALRSKRALIHEVDKRRKALVEAAKASASKSRDKTLLDVIKAEHPNAFHASVRTARERGLID